MEVRPLHLPLEYRVTVPRVLRSLNISLSKKRKEKIKLKIKKFYFEVSGLEAELVEDTKRKTFHRIYPVEFIPIMINIINDYVYRK